jgi:signal peptidase I
MTIMITAKRGHALRRYWVVIIGIALTFATLIFRGFFQFTIVVGDSMLPTLAPGDLLLVDKRAYQNQEPCRDDIVVARYAENLIVKRIVGLPGEELEVRKGTLFINGTAHNENHSVMAGSLDIAKGKLFSGDFATLGDNRAIPAVLAVHPIISKPDILGKVVFSTGNRL